MRLNIRNIDHLKRVLLHFWVRQSEHNKRGVRPTVYISHGDHGIE